MANKIHIRVRKETNNLYLDFAYLGCRCREQTALKDTPANRKKVESLVKRIEARMLLSEFDYENFFPNSKNLKKIYQQSESVNGIKSNTTDATTSSFKIYAEQWFSLKKVEWRNSHSINMLSVLEGSLIPFFGQKDLRAITKQDILTFRSMLCQKPGRTSIFLTPKTINNHMQLLHSILADAADEYSFTSPFRKIKTLKSKKGHIAPFSLEEVDQIIRCVREDYKNYYKVRFFTGMRTGEIDGLQWKNVDFKNKQILIREALVRGNLEYTKTDGSQREIPMLGPVYEALKDQYLRTFKHSSFVFCNANYQPLDHNNVTNRVWYPLLRCLGLEKRRPYMSRHTAATLLLASGESPEFIARFLGHTSTEMLFKTYSRYVPNLTRNDGSAFEKLLKHKEEEQ